MGSRYHDIRRDFIYDMRTGKLWSNFDPVNKFPELITTKTVRYQGRSITTIQLIFIYVTGDRFPGVIRKDGDVTNNKWENFAFPNPYLRL